MTSPQFGDIVDHAAIRETPADPADIASAVYDYLTNELKASPADVIVTHEPEGHTLAFSFPGRLTGSVRITGPRTLSLSYIVANMWEYRERSEFETLDELCSFLARLIRLVRRFTSATFGSASA